MKYKVGDIVIFKRKDSDYRRVGTIVDIYHHYSSDRIKYRIAIETVCAWANRGSRTYAVREEDIIKNTNGVFKAIMRTTKKWKQNLI